MNWSKIFLLTLFIAANVKAMDNVIEIKDSQKSLQKLVEEKFKERQQQEEDDRKKGGILTSCAIDLEIPDNLPLKAQDFVQWQNYLEKIKILLEINPEKTYKLTSIKTKEIENLLLEDSAYQENNKHFDHKMALYKTFGKQNNNDPTLHVHNTIFINAANQIAADIMIARKNAVWWDNLTYNCLSIATCPLWYTWSIVTKNISCCTPTEGTCWPYSLNEED